MGRQVRRSSGDGDWASLGSPTHDYGFEAVSKKQTLLPTEI